MINDFIKQSEWDALAASEEDIGKQILRPFNETQWSILAADIIKKLELNSTLISMLDVGCGNAYLSSLFQENIGLITGVDYSETMILKARKKIPLGKFEVSNADKLPFKDQNFDRTLCYSIFHYFSSKQQVFDTIDELCRVTRKGGIILVGDILDDRFEEHIKSKSDMNLEATLPKIKRYSEWRFVNLEEVTKYLIGKNYQVEVLLQNESFATSVYRRDLKIWV